MRVVNTKGKKFRVPDATILRLPLYLDKLILLQQAGVKEVSSRQLATSLDIKASQLRHDFHYFGGFSKPGRPYQVDKLVPALEEIIGVDVPVPMIIVGAGHLGQGLANYRNFERLGFPLRGIFDVDPKLVGLEIRGVPIRPLSEMPAYVQENGIRVGVLTVPVGWPRTSPTRWSPPAWSASGTSRRPTSAPRRRSSCATSGWRWV
ncbi:MAG: redox-sensing transcriptional repressor Rex [bacterium]|nr:redox-sensing transcriptional repressor Rex [bacterium]